MLKNRLKVQDIAIQKLKRHYSFSFKVTDREKAFAFDEAVANYCGTIVRKDTCEHCFRQGQDDRLRSPSAYLSAQLFPSGHSELLCFLQYSRFSRTS